MLIRTLMLAAALGAGTAAGAATLDFTTLGSGTVPGTSAAIAGATLTSGGDAFFVGANVANSLCALSAAAFTCQNDLTIDFTDVVSDLSFSSNGYDFGDFVALSVFGLGGALLGVVDIEGDIGVDLTAFGAITSLFFNDSSTGAGYAYSDFSFQTAAVPVPAALPLLASALGGLALLRRRRRAGA